MFDKYDFRHVSITYLPPIGTILGILLLWEAAFHIFQIPTFVIPAPSGIIIEIWEWKSRLFNHMLVTLYGSLGGLVLSLGIGVPLAVLFVYSRAMANAVYPLLVITQAVPKVAMAPVIMLIVGTGSPSKLLIAFLISFFPIIVDTTAGLASTPPELLDLGRIYKTSKLKIFLKVRFPMALPFFFSGLKVAITLAVVGATVAEFVGSDSGLGYIIIAATSYWNAELAFGAMIVLSLMAIILFGLAVLAERLLCPWYISE